MVSPLGHDFFFVCLCYLRSTLAQSQLTNLSLISIEHNIHIKTSAQCLLMQKYEKFQKIIGGQGISRSPAANSLEPPLVSYENSEVFYKTFVQNFAVNTKVCKIFIFNLKTKWLFLFLYVNKIFYDILTYFSNRNIHDSTGYNGFLRQLMTFTQYKNYKYRLKMSLFVSVILQFSERIKLSIS